MTMGELTAADVAAVTRPNFMGMGGYGGFGGGWEGLIALVVLAALFGGGGFGGFGGGGASAVYGAQQFSQLDSGIRAVQNGIADATYALNNNLNGINMNLSNALCSTTYELAGKIDANRFAQQQCCCDIERAIDSVNYNNTQNTQKVLDKLCSMEMSAKDQRIAELLQKNTQQEFMISQSKQNAYLINALNPTPIPAYFVQNPKCCNSPCGYGFAD